MQKKSCEKSGLRVKTRLKAGACADTSDGCPIDSRWNSVFKVCQPCLAANPVGATYPY